ncbi:hypothetical protein ACHAXR_003796, partial [Thalassiosira sp. AJA248-18]
MKNHPAASREAEIVTRKKIFKLKYQGYLEAGYVLFLLVIPRFIVEKLVLLGVVLDVRCVWDSRSNGHNVTLFVPGFMLPTFQNAMDMVVKWLPMPVGDYLELGSPVVDYT